MAIWVGHDGTLNDDDGDGPAAPGDPMEALVGYFGYPGVYPGYFHGFHGWYPEYYVGQDDFGSALGSIGSALGSAFGGSGGGAGGGGSGGFDFGSIASSFGSAFGGSGGAPGGGGGDTGSAIANIFGQVAKVAVPAATQAISKAAQSHPQAQTQAPTQHPATTTTAPSQPHTRQSHAVDPKVRANLVLSHLAKQYGMTPPAGGGAGSQGNKTSLADVGSFVQNMMGGPKTDGTGAAATTGHYVGDLFENLGASAHRAFSHRPISHELPHLHGGLHLDIPFGRRAERTYPAYSTPRRLDEYPAGYRETRQYAPSYPYYPDQGYARQQGYAREQGYAQPQQTYAQSQGPYAEQQGMYAPPTTRAPVQQPSPPVTYQPYPMPQPPPVTPRRRSSSSMDVGPIETSRSREGSSAMEIGPMTVTHPDPSKLAQVSASAPRGNVGKFVSKMMGGPGAHPAMVPDEDLRGIQRLMNQYFATKVLQEDGIMGDETHRILKQFQKMNGIPETGIPDPATRKVLKAEQDRQAGLISMGTQARQMQETLQSAFGGTAAVTHAMSADQQSAMDAGDGEQPAVSGFYSPWGWR